MLKVNKEEENKELTEYMLALEDPHKKKLVDIGRELFPNSTKEELEKQRTVKVEKENVQATLGALKEKYNHVFSINELCDEIKEYNLKLTNTSDFEGDYDYEYIEKVSKFIEDNNLNVPINDLRYRFSILTSSTTNKNPLIFYKHKEGGSNGKIYYVMIDGDKNYINIINWVLGAFNLTPNKQGIGIGLVTLIITSIFASVLGIFCWGNGLFMIPLLSTIIFTAIGTSMMKDSDNKTHNTEWRTMNLILNNR